MSINSALKITLNIVIGVVILYLVTIFFGTPEQKKILHSMSAYVADESVNIISIVAHASIIIVLLIILGVSTFAFFTTLDLRKKSPGNIKFENYVLITNISFICGIASLICLMIFTIWGIPDFLTATYTCLAVFLGVLLALYNRTYIEPNALICIILLDTMTKEIRVYFKGFAWRSIFAKYQNHIDLEADITSEIEDDFPTATPGTMFRGKASVISKAYLGEEDTPIEEKAKNAMKFIEYRKTIKKEQDVFAKMTMQDFYKSEEVEDCEKAKAAEIFPPNCFDPLASRYPIKFSEPTVYDSQPDEKTLEQRRKLTDVDNFKTMLVKLMRGKNIGLDKQDALVLAAFFSGIDWKKAIDENNYNINFTGLPENLTKTLTPDAIKAIATAAVAFKGGGKGKKTSSPKKTN